MKVCTIASGSGGNCVYVSAGDTHILIDAGISCRRISTALKALGVEVSDLSGVLITHEHTDHVAGLTTMMKHHAIPLYASAPTLNVLKEKLPVIQGGCFPVTPGERADIGAIAVTPFATSHDAVASVGYAVAAGGRQMALATDLGFASEEVYRGVAGADLLICETNHDVDWLRSGPYPYPLQQRILGDRGHLSNEAGAELAAWAAAQGTKILILAHLSRENNTAARAWQAVERKLRTYGLEPGQDVTVTVAGPDEPGPIFELEEKEAALW